MDWGFLLEKVLASGVARKLVVVSVHPFLSSGGGDWEITGT